MTDRLSISLEHGANRPEKIDAACALFDCGKSRAVMACIEYTLAMAGDNMLAPTGALEEALAHPDMTPELAAALSTKRIRLEYEVSRALTVE